MTNISLNIVTLETIGDRYSIFYIYIHSPSLPLTVQYVYST
jgi:hypothetical protein